MAKLTLLAASSTSSADGGYKTAFEALEIPPNIIWMMADGLGYGGIGSDCFTI